MAGKLSDLANRFKAAIDDTPEETEANPPPVIDEALRARAREARTELLDELVSFGKAIGGTTKSTKTGVTIQIEDMTLGFKPEGDAGLVVLDYPAADDGERIYPVLDGEELEWLYETEHRLVPLINDGLEDLMVNALGLPRPREVKEAHAPRSTEASGDVRQVLRQRALDKRDKQRARGHTTTRGENKAVWDNRPTNPGAKPPKPRPPRAAEMNRVEAGEQPTSDAWDVKVTHTEKENKRRFREFKSADGQSVGGTVKEYKGII